MLCHPICNWLYMATVQVKSKVACQKTLIVTLRCGVLQCVAVCCSVLQCVAVCCSVLKCVAMWRWRAWRLRLPSTLLATCILVLLHVAHLMYTINIYIYIYIYTYIYINILLRIFIAPHSTWYWCICIYVLIQRTIKIQNSQNYVILFCQISCYFLKYESDCSEVTVGWLRLAGSLKLKVSFAKESYKRDDILQTRPIILRSLRIVATP